MRPKEIIIVFLFLTFGLALRLYNLHERTSFNADQEWLAFRSAEVFKGDLPLLGPTTSVGSFSIGPGYIYLLSIFGLFTNNAPITGAYLSVFLGVVTLLFIYFFTKYFIDQKVAYLILFLTSISFNLISWDQLPWAPSLFYLSQIILLIGAFLSNKNQIGYFLMALGFTLGFQSHFGIVLSIISLIPYLIIVRPVKPSKKTIIATLLIILVGLLPNMLFDLTHEFINFKRIAIALKGDGSDYFVSLNKIINVLSYNITGIIYPKNNSIVDVVLTKSLFALILVNAISLLRDRKYRKISLLLLITAFVPAVLFYLQQGKFSEYYLMMSVPSLIFLFALFLNRISEGRMVLLIMLLVSIYLNGKEFINKNIPWNLKAKEETVASIIEKGGRSNYGISLTTSLGNNFGLKYILKYNEITADMPPKQGETKIFSIIIPEGFDGMVGMEDHGGIGLRWQGI
jgi:hypothetical protein